MLAAAAPAGAVEPAPGSRNFTAPSTAPNYFSNESAPFQEGARPGQPGADQFNAAPGPRGETASSRRATRTAAGSGRAKKRGKLARGKASSRQVARAGGARGGKAAAVGRAAKPARGKSIATGTRTAASQGRQAARATR